MISEIQDNIINALKGITDVKTVDIWQGDIEDLLKQPQKMPALWVIYQGCTFGDREVIGANLAPHGIAFQIVLINKNLRSAKDNAEECYSIIESVRSKLIGLDVGAEYGLLWPVREDLILAEIGVLAYGLEYKILADTEGVAI